MNELNESALQRAWRTLTKFPALMLIPLAWDAVAAVLHLFAGGEIALSSPGGRANLKFVPPPSLPSGDQLLQSSSTGVQLSINTVNDVALPLFLLGILLIVVGALVKAGFLHLLVRSLAGESPTWERFAEGIRRFGGRILGWTLLVALAMTLTIPVLYFLGPLLMLLWLVITIWFYLVDFLIVQEDLPLLTAVSLSGPRLMEDFSKLLWIVVTSLAVSGLITLVLSVIQLQVIWTTAPIWTVLGTWLTLAVLTVRANPTAP